jgi:hypothetical protein
MLKPTVLAGQETTDEDRAYSGSRFAEVCAALFDEPYQKVWPGPGSARWPVYEVTLGSVLRGILRLAAPYYFRQAAERALESHADLRWGKDGKGFRRILHPNGICLTGLWEINEDSPYSGYFRRGSRALVVARYSTCCTETRRGHSRSLAMVGKLFPTVDRHHSEPLRTASFITQQDLGGDYSDYINDVELRNAPDTSAWRRGLGIPILVASGIVFQRVDREPAQRQLYQIAELGKEANEPTRSPRFMRLLVASDQPKIEGQALDFRDEIMAQIYDPGDPAPKRQLRFRIEVTDEGITRGPAIWQRRHFQSWRSIGELRFDQAVASYNGDFVLHFNHPTWRQEPDNPATVTRI